MPRFHHVNLGVPPGGVEAQAAFITDILGYKKLEATGRAQAMGVNWFAFDDGSEIHLSEDPEHHPAERAHVALEYGDDLAGVIERLEATSWKYTTSDAVGLQVILCKDPSGNRFELRGNPIT
ncbi:MAG: glyoxalase [Acidobacteria bacterium]|nr:glyoxalase [Acidobacteriota bacterium]